MSTQFTTHKTLKSIDCTPFNGGHIKLTFGKGYPDIVEFGWFTNNPEAAHELNEYLNAWKKRHFPDTPLTTAQKLDDDIPF